MGPLYGLWPRMAKPAGSAGLAEEQLNDTVPVLVSTPTRSSSRRPGIIDLLQPVAQLCIDQMCGAVRCRSRAYMSDATHDVSDRSRWACRDSNHIGAWHPRP